METIEFIKNNFLGMAHEEQKMLLNMFMSTLSENKTKKILRVFNGTFLDYLQKINDLSSFKEQYQNFNSDKRRLTRKMVFDELINQVGNHHFDNSDESRSSHFLYLFDYDKEEYTRYFKPKSVSLEEVKNFVLSYSNLNINSKLNLIEEISSYYKRLYYFSLPVPENTLQEYKGIIKDLIGDDLIEYYDCLYSEEKMRLIINLIHNFKMFEYDEDYYHRMNSEMKKDPKIIRKLKRKATDYCYSKLNNSSQY